MLDRFCGPGQLNSLLAKQSQESLRKPHSPKPTCFGTVPQAPGIANLAIEGADTQTRHANHFSTHSDTQAIPASHCILETHTHTHIYICCEVIIWSKFGGLGKLLSGQVGFLEVIIWSKFVFLAYKNSGFKRFVLHTQLSFCVFFVPNFLAIF